jgi:hypothetical protein
MDNGDLYRQLYTLLEQNVFFGDRLDQREFVTLLSPGQFVSTKLKKTSSDDQHSLFDLTDKTIDSTFLWRPLTSTVSGLYKEIVEFAALPDKPVDQALIDKLSKDLGAMEPAYTAYRGYYDEADAAWRKAMSRDPIDENEVIDLSKKRAAALRDWENLNKGRKKIYEDTLGELNHNLAGNPRGFWETEVRQRLADLGRSSTSGANYFETLLDPHPADWATAGWQRVELRTSSVFNREYARSTNFSAGGGISFGLWSFGGSYSRSTQETQHQTNATDLTVQMDILRVNIQRRWMYQDLFARRYWAWKKASHENLLITDGGNPPDQRPLGPRGMPVLPTVFFVVRNVRLSGNWAQEDERFFAEQTQTRASFGWGPISVSGSYSESTSERTYNGQFAGGTITVEQPQIIAVGGTLLARCPNPDPGLAWSTRPGEEPWLTPPAERADLALIAEANNAHMLDLTRQRLRRELLSIVMERFDALDVRYLMNAPSETTMALLARDLA